VDALEGTYPVVSIALFACITCLYSTAALDRVEAEEARKDEVSKHREF
jgi:hypothetical protein